MPSLGSLAVTKASDPGGRTWEAVAPLPSRHHRTGDRISTTATVPLLWNFLSPASRSPPLGGPPRLRWSLLRVGMAGQALDVTLTHPGDPRLSRSECVCERSCPRIRRCRAGPPSAVAGQSTSMDLRGEGHSKPSPPRGSRTPHPHRPVHLPTPTECSEMEENQKAEIP